MSSNSERRYTTLIHRASNKYPNWDPEVTVEAGDWGRIIDGRTGKWLPRRSRGGIFLKEGNIYKDGIAEEYDIPEPIVYGAEAADGVSWVVSKHTRAWNVSAEAASQTPALAHYDVKARYHFSSNGGAILAMQNDSISRIDPPGKLRRLLDEERMHDCVIVSEVHHCSSYARYLSSRGTKDVVIGLSAEPAIPGIAAAHAHLEWVHSATTGNFKSKVSLNGSRDFCPLFRLVSLKDSDVSVGLRGASDGPVPPLPDAELPWSDEEDCVENDIAEE
ncbi:hypothetical protein SCP_0805120 [Sparassis crispa]|uniref:Uncharacterized protein n=1 Tax=Sparassis crispa TaxID=139825 RepID=A0A401GUT7_9APHY|nr:hypothetical protein SCP_0805120 [Sparassis crispa]GBE85988.1 hypothetical protein SCP_0805120 [Sparassis crispa]